MATTSSGKATVTLPTDEQILITREFDAPRHLVYKAWTTPELVKRWWSGDRGEVTLVEIDLRVGGMWRYVMVANGGFEVAFHGEYREIVTKRADRLDRGLRGHARRFRKEAAREHRHVHRGGRPHVAHDPGQPQASHPATRTSTPGWRPACKTRWASWSRSPSRSAEQASHHGPPGYPSRWSCLCARKREAARQLPRRGERKPSHRNVVASGLSPACASEQVSCRRCSHTCSSPEARPVADAPLRESERGGGPAICRIGASCKRAGACNTAGQQARSGVKRKRATRSAELVLGNETKGVATLGNCDAQSAGIVPMRHRFPGRAGLPQSTI